MQEGQESIDQQIGSLEHKSDDELLEVIGAYALSQNPDNIRASVAADGLIDINKVRETGKNFLKELEPLLKEAICGSNGLREYLEQVTAKDILLFILPILGFSKEGMVPTAIVAISFLIARVGIRKYCSY